MSKKIYKLAVSNVVVVPVKGSFVDEDGKAKPFKFSLVCKRMGADAQKEALSAGDTLIIDFMSGLITDWRDQRLVLEQDGTPAEFCADALEALFDISGIAMLCYSAYLKESAAKEKN